MPRPRRGDRFSAGAIAAKPLDHRVPWLHHLRRQFQQLRRHDLWVAGRRDHTPHVFLSAFVVLLDAVINAQAGKQSRTDRRMALPRQWQIKDRRRSIDWTERDRIYRSEGWERFDPDAPPTLPRGAPDTSHLGPAVTEDGRAPAVGARPGLLHEVFWIAPSGTSASIP